jgi:hypothetical protein
LPSERVPHRIIVAGEGSAGRRGKTQEADMERTDWLDKGFDSAQARFLMVTAITHHRFSSPLWGDGEVRKLKAELAEIEMREGELGTVEPVPDKRLDRYFAANVRARASGS